MGFRVQGVGFRVLSGNLGHSKMNQDFWLLEWDMRLCKKCSPTFLGCVAMIST